MEFQRNRISNFIELDIHANVCVSPFSSISEYLYKIQGFNKFIVFIIYVYDWEYFIDSSDFFEFRFSHANEILLGYWLWILSIDFNSFQLCIEFDKLNAFDLFLYRLRWSQFSI